MLVVDIGRSGVAHVWASLRSLSAFSLGVFVGVFYGSVVGTLTAYALFHLMY